MSESTTDDPNWESFDSHIITRVRATKRRRLDDDHPERSNEKRYFETDGHLVFDNYLRNSMVNVDHYLNAPADWLDGYPTEVHADGDEDIVLHTGYADVDVTFELYQDEVRKGAQKRAAEDFTHEVRTLAEWTWLAGGADHVSETDAKVFLVALKEAIRDTESPEPWALCYGGDPDNWTHKDDPISDIDEAYTYIKHDFGTVFDRRDEGKHE